MKNHIVPGLNWTCIENIAKDELLTKEVLIREVIKRCNSFVIQIPKRKIFKHVRKIMQEYHLTEQEVVYIFLRLYFSGAVKNFNFSKAFYECMGLLIKLWMIRYYTLIDKYQQEKIIV